MNAKDKYGNNVYTVFNPAGSENILQTGPDLEEVAADEGWYYQHENAQGNPIGSYIGPFTTQDEALRAGAEAEPGQQ